MRIARNADKRRNTDMTTTTPGGRITPLDLQRLRARRPDVRLLDVRTAAEFRRSRIEGAYNLPLDQLAAHAAELAAVTAPVVLVCRSGARARAADGVLRSAGMRHALVLEGGMLAWRAAGLPAQSTAFSTLELIRRAAGALGVVAGAFVARDNPVLAIVLLFVGLRLAMGQPVLPCAAAGTCAVPGAEPRAVVGAFVAGTPIGVAEEQGLRRVPG